MKKVVIILLIVLPFLLIYFISITGRVLEKYSHIYVESLTLESESTSLEDNSTVSIEKGTTQRFKIVIGPELASNPDVKISNYNPEICSYSLVNDELEITGLEYGMSKIVIISIDQTNIKFNLGVKVTDDVPTGIELSRTEISIKTQMYDLINLVNITFIPATTKLEYKNLIFESTDPNVVQVVDSSSGRIKGVAEGEASIIVTSLFDNNIKAEIKVKVTNQKDTDIFFDHYTTNALIINNSDFDLKSITKFSNSYMGMYSEEERFNQFTYKIVSGQQFIDADASDISQGIIKFVGNGIIKVQIRMNNDPDNYIDEITIKYTK